MEIDQMLSDNFVNFSKQIAKLQAKKKSLKMELKAHYDRIQAEIAEIEQAAKQAYDDFENGVTIESQATQEEIKTDG